MSTRSKFTSKQPQPSRTGVAKTKKANSSSRKAAPVSKALRRYQATPPVTSSRGTSMSITHREFVQDVTGQIAFTATSFPINPGRDVLFTWLSDLATRYERYQFSQLRFCYEPRCSTATAGSVILAVDYDPLDTAPATKQDVYAYAHSAQSSAWDECCFVVDQQILRNRGSLYTRAGAVPATADAKTYDLGNLWLCVSGFTGATVCGELFVEYTVVLQIPQIQSNVQSASYSGTAGVDKTHPLGTAPLVLTGLLDATLNATTVTFQQNWTGLVTIKVVGTGGGNPVTAASTATVTEVSEVLNGAGTDAMEVDTVVALRGQTIVFDVSGWTTVTAFSLNFAPTS